MLAGAEQLGFRAARIPILDAEGRSAWPEKWPEPAIAAEREEFARLGKLDIWFRNKMCECIDPGSQKFRRTV